MLDCLIVLLEIDTAAFKLKFVSSNQQNRAHHGNERNAVFFMWDTVKFVIVSQTDIETSRHTKCPRILISPHIASPT